MDVNVTQVQRFLRSYHPFDSLSESDLALVETSLGQEVYVAEAIIFGIGQDVDSLRVVIEGEVELLSGEDDVVLQVHVGDSFGFRAMGTDGIARQSARAGADGVSVYTVPGAVFHQLMERSAAFKAFFGGFAQVVARDEKGTDASLVGVSLTDLMTPNPVSVPLGSSIKDAAAIMGDKHISCVLVEDHGALAGILTTGDITSRVVAAGLDPKASVDEVMTRDPLCLSATMSGFDAMLAMSSRGIGHLPICEGTRPVGILTRTNLVRRQQVSAVYMIGDLKRSHSTEALAGIIAKLPELLVQLVGSGVPPHQIGRVITSLADAATERLLELAEEELGPAPVPYLWLACGSQGRQEQTGVSDQDNCLVLHDSYDAKAHGDYFRALATFVCDGLEKAGYIYCPGDMMATNERWRQPVSVWRGYFEGWVRKPDPMAQMLASVMFDLRPISGDTSLFEGLQEATLAFASQNSIFRAHMAANSLKHTPPLGLFRGFALIRSGEHKDTLDLKHNGVVPIVDLARMYALEGAIPVVNTRARLEAAQEAGAVSTSGASDLIDAYDLISTVRLRHQARQIRQGERPDNYLSPSRLSAFERNHLKDAFGVIKGLQSALGHGRSAG
ncbi:MAG: putative nucleotidyltransferase substrate binding domain-containing protein [Pseudomonadota bacterium]